MITNQKFIPIASAAIGLIAVALTHHYLRRQWDALDAERQKIFAGARKIDVVVAARDLPQGTVIQKSDLAKRKLFEIEATVRGHAVKAEDARIVLGRKTMFKVDRGEPLFWSDIEGGARAGMGLSPMVRPGLRAISLAVGGAAAVSGMVEPNDRVDVLGTFAFPSKAGDGEMETVTLTVLQDVTVLAAGQMLGSQDFAFDRPDRRASYSTVTIEVTPREAELLVFAQQLKGALTLSLRNPGDMSYEKDLPSVDFKRLQDSLPELNAYRQQEIRGKRGVAEPRP